MSGGFRQASLSSSRVPSVDGLKPRNRARTVRSLRPKVGLGARTGRVGGDDELKASVR